MVDRIEVRPAPASTPSPSRSVIVAATTSAGSIEIVLSAGEAATLMFEIGHALEQADRLAESGNRPVRTADHARVLPSGGLP
ncbi:MAG: hypothetical protein WC729_25970 [Sphingomonas sp.]|jgi:hypothetical protein|uniref:hypothetical protein n=1 Tax=Sphingomonas sp. TaxID=28214 RepID=UPI0035623620